MAGPGDRGLGQGDPTASLFTGTEGERERQRWKFQELPCFLDSRGLFPAEGL